MSDFLNWELTNRMHNLGYDGKTLMYIDDEEDIINDDSAELIGAKPAILTSAAFRWFRKKYNFHHYIEPIHRDGKVCYEYCVVNSSEDEKQFNEEDIAPSYEEAELECLKKLIQIVKNTDKK